MILVATRQHAGYPSSSMPSNWEEGHPRSQAKGQLKSTFFRFVLLSETHPRSQWNTYSYSHSHSHGCVQSTHREWNCNETVGRQRLVLCFESPRMEWSQPKQRCLLRGNWRQQLPNQSLSTSGDLVPFFFFARIATPSRLDGWSPLKVFLKKNTHM